MTVKMLFKPFSVRFFFDVCLFVYLLIIITLKIFDTYHVQVVPV